MPRALLDVLTPRALRDLAGPFAFARGIEYANTGHVRDVNVIGETATGVVVGGESYTTVLAIAHDALISHCTCPAPQMCKHAVALGIAALTEHAPKSAQSRTLSSLSIAETPDDPASFATWRELEAWVSERRIAHALQIPADTLIPALPASEVHRYGLPYLLGRLSLRDVGTLDGMRRMVGVRALEAPIARAVRAALEQAAEQVRVGCDEERERRAAHPEAALAPLWAQLIDLRRAVRAHAAPRACDAVAHGVWRFDPNAAAVTWLEAGRLMRNPPERGTVALAARLMMPNAGAALLECTCGAASARCTHALALLDATLDVLDDPSRATEARTLAEALLRPGWARLLAELDRIEDRVIKPPAAIEVWWRIDEELGAITLSPIVKKQLKSGAMSAGSKPTVARMLDEHRDSLSELDLAIAEQVTSWAAARAASGTRTMHRAYPVRAFAALVGHPRVITEWSEQPVEIARASLGFTALPSGEHIRLEASIDGEHYPAPELDAALRQFAPGDPLILADIERQRCVLVDVHDDARRLWQLLDKHGAAFPPESHAPLLDRLAKIEARVPIALPPVLKGAALDYAPAVVARMRLLPDVSLELELMVRPGPGAPLYQPGSGPRDVMLVRDGVRGYVRRTLDSEPEEARQKLAEVFLDGPDPRKLPDGVAVLHPGGRHPPPWVEGPPYCFHLNEPDHALALIAALQTPPDGLEVEWLDVRPTITRSVGPESLRIHVDRRRDWFGIAGEIKLEQGRLELAVLLDAARRQQRYVRVDDRGWLEMSDLLRKRLLAVADQTYAARQHLELSPGAVPAIRALADAGAKVETAPDWQKLTKRLASSLTLVPEPPAGLTTALRDYQVEGHAWLSRVAAWGAGACLADDMGLGKTVQAIAVLLDRARLGPALVLAPTSVAHNWVSELERFAPGLSPIVYGAEPDRARRLAQLGKKDVVIASYGLLVRDADLLAGVPFATLIVDEAQALKNASTHRARAARRLDAQFRIALSGTPFENHLGELWSLFAVIFPGLLGSWEQFRDRYAGPIERTKDPDARAALSRVLRPFLLRRTKQEVARELPSRTEIEVPVVLSKEERGLYEDARLAAVAELDRQGKAVRDPQRRFQVLAALTRLRLLASHPRLYDGQSQIASSKLRRLVELLDELRSEGHRALVFSQFTSHLALVREELERADYALLYLDGATPAAQRAKRIAAFQAGEADVFLISLKAGGTGINLTAADYVIHLDPWWNPAVEDQATDRAHRIGQTRPVTVYRLIACGTIEEKILGMHRDKRALFAGVLDGTDVAAQLSTQDLLSLLATSHGIGGASDLAADAADPADPDEPPPTDRPPAPPPDELAQRRKKRARRT